MGRRRRKSVVSVRRGVGARIGVGANGGGDGKKRVGLALKSERREISTEKSDVCVPVASFRTFGASDSPSFQRFSRQTKKEE